MLNDCRGFALIHSNRRSFTKMKKKGNNIEPHKINKYNILSIRVDIHRQQELNIINIF